MISCGSFLKSFVLVLRIEPDFMLFKLCDASLGMRTRAMVSLRIFWLVDRRDKHGEVSSCLNLIPSF